MAAFASGLCFMAFVGPADALVPPGRATTIEEPKSTTPRPHLRPQLPQATLDRLADFVQRASQLAMLTSDGVNLGSYQQSLAEVESSWEALSIFGLPTEIESATKKFEIAIESWRLTGALWAERVAASKSGEVEQYSQWVEAGPEYGPRLLELAARMRRESLAPPPSIFCFDSGRERAKLRVGLQELVYEASSSALTAVEGLLDSPGGAKRVAAGISSQWAMTLMRTERYVENTYLGLGDNQLIHSTFWRRIDACLQAADNGELQFYDARVKLAQLILDVSEEQAESLMQSRMEVAKLSIADELDSRPHSGLLNKWLLNPDAAISWGMRMSSICLEGAKQDLKAILQHGH